MKNQLKIGVLLSYLTMFLGIIISIGLTPYKLRVLGQKEFGLYTLALSTVGYLGLLNFGIGGSYLRKYSQLKIKLKTQDEEFGNLNAIYLIIFTVLGLIALLVGIFMSLNPQIIFGDKLNSKELEKIQYLILILSISSSIGFPLSIFSSYIFAEEKFIFAKILGILFTIITPLLTIIILYLGMKTMGMALVTLVIQILTFAFSICYCLIILKMKIKLINIDFKLIHEIFIFSSFIFLNMIIDQINWSVDKILLARFWGTTSVAIYGIASQLNAYVLSFSTNVSSVFAPKVNRLIAENNKLNEINELFIRVGRIQYIILNLLLSGLIIFGKEFILLWAGQEYLTSYYITLIITLPLIIPLIQNLGLEIQRAKNKHQFRVLVYTIIAVLNLMISIPLSKLYGGVGAAIGTALGLLIGNGLIMNIYYHKKLDLNIIKFWKEIIFLSKGLILPSIFGVIIKILVRIDTWLYLLQYIVLYTMIYLLSIYKYGLNEQEKKLIIPIFIKLKKQVKVLN